MKEMKFQIIRSISMSSIKGSQLIKKNRQQKTWLIQRLKTYAVLVGCELHCHWINHTAFKYVWYICKWVQIILQYFFFFYLLCLKGSNCFCVSFVLRFLVVHGLFFSVWGSLICDFSCVNEPGQRNKLSFNTQNTCIETHAHKNSQSNTRVPCCWQTQNLELCVVQAVQTNCINNRLSDIL